MNVGQGIKDAMTAAGDYPVQDSQFTKWKHRSICSGRS